MIDIKKLIESELPPREIVGDIEQINSINTYFPQDAVPLGDLGIEILKDGLRINGVVYAYTDFEQVDLPVDTTNIIPTQYRYRTDSLQRIVDDPKQDENPVVLVTTATATYMVDGVHRMIRAVQKEKDIIPALVLDLTSV